MFAAVFGVAVLLYNSKENTVLYEKFLWYIGTPFLVLVPVVLAIIRCAGQRKKHLRSGAVICVLLGLMGLSGCATSELEERNYPIEMAVSVMEQFDRIVFESIVEKIIVGETYEDGTVDPYKLTFVLKGMDDRSIPYARDRYMNLCEKAV